MAVYNDDRNEYTEKKNTTTKSSMHKWHTPTQVAE